MSVLDPQELAILLRYDPATGKLFWLPRPREMFPDARSCSTWNARFAGRQALTATTSGYLHGAIRYRLYRAHRVAWAIAHGRWPTADIDHINGDRRDNRLINLREASRAENNRNCGKRGGNTSRFVGVHWDPARTKKWRAQITDSAGRRHAIGGFDSEEDAARAYDAAAERWHGEFARLNFERPQA